ncbi:MAG: deoxyribodipyrimidine photo-lyase [Thermoplasmatota archaeon]
MDERRVRQLTGAAQRAGPVVYWMSRDQRARDNWALIHAQELAADRDSHVMVAFCLAPSFLGATTRQYDFMLDGLRETAATLHEHGIPFYLLTGEPAERISRFVEEHGIGVLVTDFDPLRVKREWKQQVTAAVEIPVYEVDAHNVVPARIASDKKEYAAYTIRPKIHRLLPSFLQPFPSLQPQKLPKKDMPDVDWTAARAALNIDDSIAAVNWLLPGETAARETLHLFVTQKLQRYPEQRNNPAIDGLSNLSPYLHFGHISAQHVALTVQQADGPQEAKDAFLEELVVRRELSDNYCWYEPGYDSPRGFPDWAQRTLAEHRGDKREYVYTLGEFERAGTHDELWNAAQQEMAKRGKMHGYLRMYWAKKILEWTTSPADAMSIAIYLNDRYELDGRDPNGYTGVAWATGGVHDRAWPERPVYGKVRYMSHGGAQRKFDVDGYIDRVASLRR